MVPLSGLTVAVKDMFDVRGYPATGGTTVRADLPVATKDGPAVARLRAAGAGLIGHANITELAYSGLGMTPHYGTPLPPCARVVLPMPSTAVRSPCRCAIVPTRASC